MKTSRFFLHYSIRVAFALLVSIELGSPVVYAQTFAGQAQLTESPSADFQALVYPVVTRLKTIRVNFDNPSRGSVRVEISDQRGNVVYDKLESAAHYRQYFNLSLMPAGLYLIKLGSRDATYTQTFRVEPPTPGRIALVDERADNASLHSEKLMVR